MTFAREGAFVVRGEPSAPSQGFLTENQFYGCTRLLQSAGVRLSRCGAITKVTFTQADAPSSIHLVVWQFWGRAAEAS